jgi:hypothetical protein
LPEITDKAIAFRYRDELGWRNITVNRMVPPQKALEAVNLSGLNVDLRLVSGPELAELDRLPQIPHQRRARLHVLVKPGAIENHTPPALPLGLVQRQVSPAEKIGRGIAVTWNHGDADTRPDKNLVSKNIDGPQQRGNQWCHHRLGVAFRGNICRYDGELIAAEPHEEEIVRAFCLKA